MPNNDNIDQHYATLNLQPGCTWQELRLAYKKQIQKWHPDRFKGNEKEKEAAEDKIKNINIAFNYFLKYYRENKSLPVSISEKSPGNRPQERATKRSSETRRDTTTTHYKDKSRSSFLTVSVTLAVVFFIFYVMLIEDEDAQIQSIESVLIPESKKQAHSPTPDEEPTGTSKNIENEIKAEIAEKEEEEKEYFTLGSNIGQVINAQGEPSRIVDDTWYYGEARVYFKDGVVSGWKRDPDTPLNIKLDIE